MLVPSMYGGLFLCENGVMSITFTSEITKLIPTEKLFAILHFAMVKSFIHDQDSMDGGESCDYYEKKALILDNLLTEFAELQQEFILKDKL
jgi:hypothetical protein